jgi:hypothetical protein
VIAVILGDLRWRIVMLVPLAIVLFALEPGFHQHEEFDPTAIALGPLGVSATLAYLAGLSMIILLGGFISADRREGYTRLLFAHPTSPVAYYGLRWGIAYALSFGAALLFLVFGQLIAWGEVRGGWSGLVLPAISALVYGGLVSFFSVLLRRGDTWLAFLFFLPTFVPEILSLGLGTAHPLVRQSILLLLPPQSALQEVWNGLLFENFAWDAAAFAAGYGALFLLTAGALLSLLEWP